MRAVIYCRVSSDPHQRGKSVTEQEAECRALAEKNGWDIAEPVLVDNDRGASRYSRGERPAYKQLADILRTGDVLVTWEASRAQRDLAAYLQLRELCTERGVLWCYSGKVHDLTAGDDRFITGLDALLAEKEVEQSRERILRAVRANAAAGKPHGKLPYGYMIVRDPTTGDPVDRVPDPETAPIVREAFGRVLSGEPLNVVVRDLNARGIPGPRPRRDGTPAPWIAVTLRKIIESPTYAGLRTHRGEVIGPATWEPLVTAEDHERMRALLADPARLTHRGCEPRWLLSGIALCGVCDARLRAQRNRTNMSYMCTNGFHVSRKTGNLDTYVVENVIRRLEGQDLAFGLDDADIELTQAREAAAALQRRLDAFADEAATGALSPSALARVEARIAPQIAAAEKRVRSLISSPLVAELAGRDAREKWFALPIRQQRELLRAVVDVRVLPTSQGYRGPTTAENVTLTWR